MYLPDNFMYNEAFSGHNIGLYTSHQANQNISACVKSSANASILEKERTEAEIRKKLRCCLSASATEPTVTELPGFCDKY